MLKVELVCTEKFWGQRVPLLVWGAQQVACCGSIINYIISSMYDCIHSRRSSSAASAALLVATGSIRRSRRQRQRGALNAPEHPPPTHSSHTYARMCALHAILWRVLCKKHIFCNPRDAPGMVKLSFVSALAAWK
jgi:hypothetical protein